MYFALQQLLQERVLTFLLATSPFSCLCQKIRLLNPFQIISTLTFFIHFRINLPSSSMIISTFDNSSPTG